MEPDYWGPSKLKGRVYVSWMGHGEEGEFGARKVTCQLQDEFIKRDRGARNQFGIDENQEEVSLLGDSGENGGLSKGFSFFFFKVKLSRFEITVFK